jgi:adenosine deaminase
VYLELRSTPKALLSKKGGERSTISDYIDTVLRAIKDGETSENGMIRVRYIASINRSAPVDYAVEVVNLALKYKEAKESYLVGVELSGDPRTGKFSDFKDAFDKAKAEGLKVSLHCSELPEQNIETPEMLDFKPDRLGHCIYMVSL